MVVVDVDCVVVAMRKCGAFLCSSITWSWFGEYTSMTSLECTLVKDRRMLGDAGC